VSVRIFGTTYHCALLLMLAEAAIHVARSIWRALRFLDINFVIYSALGITDGCCSACCMRS